VARCLPLARAFAELGFRASFVGAYDGLAAWLLARAGMQAAPADPDFPCGVASTRYGAAVVDSYALAPEAICALAARLPLATLAEANRCPDRGIVLDYHLDRTERRDERLLRGASFAPLDPAFAGAGHPGRQVRRALVSLGGSRAARALAAEIASAVRAAFPAATVLLAPGAPPGERGRGPQSETTAHESQGVVELPWPSALVDWVRDIDVAVGAAGLTAYELACAGVPQVTIAIAPNQRRVLDGLRKRELALCIDLTRGEGLGELPSALERLRDPELRLRLSRCGAETFDGGGARRAAIALTESFRAASKGLPSCTPVARG
jgi:spore coat polysaccharide biosynthesis predicted glycosyltransferase SpsG